MNACFLGYLRLPRVRRETDGGYARRQRQALRSQKIKLNIVDLDVVISRRIYRHAGDIARRCRREPELLISRALQWNRHGFTISNIRPGSGGRSDRYGFPIRFNNWHWESQLTRCLFGRRTDWLEEAQERRSWNAAELAFLKCCLGGVVRTAVGVGLPGLP